jgi:hypothetical protein
VLEQSEEGHRADRHPSTGVCIAYTLHLAHQRVSLTIKESVEGVSLVSGRYPGRHAHTIERGLLAELDGCPLPVDSLSVGLIAHRGGGPEPQLEQPDSVWASDRFGCGSSGGTVDRASTSTFVVDSRVKPSPGGDFLVPCGPLAHDRETPRFRRPASHHLQPPNREIEAPASLGGLLRVALGDFVPWIGR